MSMTSDLPPDHPSWLETLSLSLGALILAVQLWYVINEATHGELNDAAKRWWHRIGKVEWENVRFMLFTEDVMTALINDEIVPWLGRH